MQTLAFLRRGRVAAAALALVGLGGVAAAQPAQLTVGIYAPTVEFGTAQARLVYVQGIAKAIEQSTGLKTEAQSYATIAALKQGGVDYAIIDGVCYATNLNWRLLASSTIGGGTTRAWALYSSAGDTMQGLRGKRLAFIATGCSDAAFVDNAMLESEVDPGFFSARTGKTDLTGAIAEVASYRAADAVFAPTGSAKGLAKVFDTGVVPNPAFVDVGGKQPAAVTEKVAAAVIGYSGGGAIAGWTRPQREIYAAFSGRLNRLYKTGMPAAPEVVRIDAKDALIDPPTLKETAVIDVRHLFVRASGDRME